MKTKEKTSLFSKIINSVKQCKRNSQPDEKKEPSKPDPLRIPICELYFNREVCEYRQGDCDFMNLYYNEAEQRFFVLRYVYVYPGLGCNDEYFLEKDYFENHTIDDFAEFLKNIEEKVSVDSIKQNDKIISLFDKAQPKRHIIHG